MSRRRVLFVLSADFGEYVTAALFSCGQQFDHRFAAPAKLAPYFGDGRSDFDVYEDADGIRRILAAGQPDLVVLCSGYLFSINRLIAPQALAKLVDELHQRGIVVATTDPWLRVFALNPEAHFTIHSVRKDGVDAEASDSVMRLHRSLEGLFGSAPHLLAVPVPASEDNWMPFYNPEFSCPVKSESAAQGEDEWVFVLAREDFVLLAGFERERFFGSLRARIDELMSVPQNRITFIGPPDMASFFGEQTPRWPRVTYVPFCSFTAFEAAIRRARVVVYWNVLSASLLYCLYHRVPPVFFGRGHQVKVCPALYAHVMKHVYCGRAPHFFDMSLPLGEDADARYLIERLGIESWLEAIGADYARLPTPASVVDRIVRDHVS